MGAKFCEYTLAEVDGNFLQVVTMTVNALTVLGKFYLDGLDLLESALSTFHPLIDGLSLCY